MKQVETKYKIGITTYDEWNLLWETKIGLTDKKQTLLYSAWGKSEKDSLNNAIKLKEYLLKLAVEIGKLE